ncbi:MAG: LysM peptidoglycan-binding domain-containing protein [Chloroflexi bacterium]|nr:LysM peptidoglycan-binding domain-containing protein [Chloroflexota bacterium]
MRLKGPAVETIKLEAVGPNLLTNPGMDGKYVKQCSLRNGGQPWVQVPCPADYNAEVGDIKQWETTQVPAGWSAWWQQPNTNFDDPNYFNTYPHFCPDWKSTPADCKAWHNPEYRDTLGGPQETGPERKVAGDNSQKYFTFYSLHEAGLYQVVSGVRPGDLVRFTIFLEGWSTGNNDPFKSDLNQRMNMQVGIDPTGGNDPWSSNIIWTSPAESFDKFTQFAVEAVAKNNIVSVWTKSRPMYALQHVDVYADEASLTVVQPAKVAKAPVKSTRLVTSTQIITTTRQITGTDGIVYTALITQSVIVTKTVPVTTSSKPVTTAKVVTSTKIITSTRLVTGTNGVVSRAVVTQSVIVTGTIPVTTTKAVTTTKSTKPVTSTTATKSVSGTLPTPASGTYTVVRGDTLIAIARRFGITPWWRLAELNNLTEPYKIEVGQALKLK